MGLCDLIRVVMCKKPVKRNLILETLDRISKKGQNWQRGKGYNLCKLVSFD